MLPLVGLGLWHALSPARLRLELRGAGLEERWARAQKKARPCQFWEGACGSLQPAPAACGQAGVMQEPLGAELQPGQAESTHHIAVNADRWRLHFCRRPRRRRPRRRLARSMWRQLSGRRPPSCPACWTTSQRRCSPSACPRTQVKDTLVSPGIAAFTSKRSITEPPAECVLIFTSRQQLMPPASALQAVALQSGVSQRAAMAPKSPAFCPAALASLQSASEPELTVQALFIAAAATCAAKYQPTRQVFTVLQAAPRWRRRRCPTSRSRSCCTAMNPRSSPCVHWSLCIFPRRRGDGGGGGARHPEAGAAVLRALRGAADRHAVPGAPIAEAPNPACSVMASANDFSRHLLGCVFTSVSLVSDAAAGSGTQYGVMLSPTVCVSNLV